MIVSRSNETLKAIRRLRRRQDDRRILLEGPHLLEAALDLGLEIETVLASPGFLAAAEGRALLPRLPRPPLEVRADLLDALADADAPKGVLAVALPPRRGLEILPLAADGVYLFLDRIQDPGNVGAIGRVAAAFSVAGLALSPGCADPLHPRALRGSAGALLGLPVAVGVEVAELARRLAPLGAVWAALEAHGGAEIKPPAPRALVLALGSEGSGLSPQALERCSVRWTIRLAPGVESLNVAVSAGIALHALRRSPLA